MVFMEMRKVGESVIFMEDQKEKLITFEAIKKVKEIINHKKQTAYRNTGWMSPGLEEMIDRVVMDCRVSQNLENPSQDQN